jgi:hypothetical protein
MAQDRTVEDRPEWRMRHEVVGGILATVRATGWAREKGVKVPRSSSCSCSRILRTSMVKVGLATHHGFPGQVPDVDVVVDPHRGAPSNNDPQHRVVIAKVGRINVDDLAQFAKDS